MDVESYQVTICNFAKFALYVRDKSGTSRKKVLGVVKEMFYKICFYFAVIHVTYIIILFVFNYFDKLVLRISLDRLKWALASIKS